MDKQFRVLKTDYLVPAVTGGIIRGPIVSNISVTTRTAQATLLAASEIGNMVIHASADPSETIGINLPAASSVTAYWGARPGDVFTTTVLNTGSAAQQFVTNTSLGIAATVGNASTAAYLGATFQYVIGGTVAVPSATVYII